MTIPVLSYKRDVMNEVCRTQKKEERQIQELEIENRLDLIKNKDVAK